MKRLYSPLLLSCVMGIVNFSSAQISVTATSGNTGPVVYTTLKAAFDAVNAGTHQGAILLSISSSTVETAKVIINGSGMGAASYTSVTLKPAPGTSPTISGALASGIIAFNRASNVIIDGSNTAGGTTTNLSIVNQGSNGEVISFIIGASHNVVKNCLIRSTVQNSGTIVFSTSDGVIGNNYNTIENNDIANSDGGFPFAAILNNSTPGIVNKGNRILNNRIYNFASFGFTDGALGGGYSDSTLVEGNEFYSTLTIPTSLTVIYIEGLGGIRNMKISKNKIYNLSSLGSQVAGIMIFDAISVTVENNMISLSNSPSELLGIAQEAGGGATIKIYHNTVYISGTTSDFNSFALFKNWFSTGDDFRDNILINTRENNNGTKGQYAFVKLNGGTFTSNYNNLVSIGNTNNYVAFTNVSSNPTYYKTLANWQSGTSQDANSISVSPAFISLSDLHLVPGSNAGIDNLGNPVSTVLTDIDGQTRSTITPDMGADEFANTTGCVAPLIAVPPVALTVCLGQAASFSVTVNGTGPLIYQWIKNGNNISGATNSSYSIASTVAADAGNYQVSITGTCGTVNSTPVGLSVTACTSIPLVMEGMKGIVLIPNLVTNRATLKVHAIRSMQLTCAIVDMNGKMVHSFKNQINPGPNEIELILSALPAGFYQLQIQTRQGSTGSLRFLKL